MAIKKVELEKLNSKQDNNRVENNKRIELKRRLFALGYLPPLNTVIRYDNQYVVYLNFGKNFRIRADHPSYEGSHLLGHEGNLGCYAYYRYATKSEIESVKK